MRLTTLAKGAFALSLVPPGAYNVTCTSVLESARS